LKVDLALVGGGLANSLIAYRMLRRQPDFPLVIIERAPTLGANHTWSFHDSDLTPDQRDWIRPLVVQSWPQHELRFPKRRRVIDNGYNAISSERLQELVGKALGDRCVLGMEVTEVAPHGVRLVDGTHIRAGAVIDGRGNPGGHHFEVAYQKFVGLFLRLENGHGLQRPILMDATVEQRDGYRFVYTLPFSEHHVLIEDTYYSDTPDFDVEDLRARILAYASSQSWRVTGTSGEESGILPIVLAGDIDAFWAEGPPQVPRSGMRAALFHPTTGYSLPEAARLADEIATSSDLGGAALFQMTRRRSVDLWHRFAFFRLLNRMLFRAAEPDQRYLVFQRFYGLPTALIERFYAGRLEWKDKLRLLTGKPPVPLGRALRCLLERPRSRPTVGAIESKEPT
jgi:lycopene beta-cyclase